MTKEALWLSKPNSERRHFEKHYSPRIDRATSYSRIAKKNNEPYVLTATASDQLSMPAIQHQFLEPRLMSCDNEKNNYTTLITKLITTLCRSSGLIWKRFRVSLESVLGRSENDLGTVGSWFALGLGSGQAWSYN
jgi:hypothetical protein